MRYAIFSDIHANLVAWEAVLADMREQSPDMLVCLGDVVGYGPKPGEVLDRIREVTENIILGNHDAAAAGLLDYSCFREQARHAIEWTRDTLSDEALKFLASVPLAIDEEDLLFVHAEIPEPGRFHYINTTEDAAENFAASKHFVTFVGHTHHPKIFQRTSGGLVGELPDANRRLAPNVRYIVNVGSVGDPRNADDLTARYVIYDSETREVDFRSLPFDTEAYRAHLAATSLKAEPFFLQVADYLAGDARAAAPGASQALQADAPVGAAVAMTGQPVRLRAPKLSAGGIPAYRPGATQSARNSWLPMAAAIVLFAGSLAFILWRGMNRDAGDPPPVLAKTGQTGEHSDPPAVASGDGEDDFEYPDDDPDALDEEDDPRPGVATAQPEATPPRLDSGSANVAAVKPQPSPPREPAEPEPPAPPAPMGPTVAWWRMDPDSAGGPLIDTTGTHVLPAEVPGKQIDGLAPARLPGRGTPNKAALQLGVWTEENLSGAFELLPEESFTLEGWVLTDAPRRPIFLAGTRSGDAADKQGWHLDIRPPGGQIRFGQMGFYYDNGPGAVQAVSEDLKISDLKPHHFAVVWDHDASAGDGEMRLYVEGELAASCRVPRSGIAASQANPFRIGSPDNPARLALDEVRFSRVALGPHQFLRSALHTMEKKGAWKDAGNWKGGIAPSGTATAVIAAGVHATVNDIAAPFTGDLILMEKARLTLDKTNGGVLPKAPAKLVLHQGASIVVTCNSIAFGPIVLEGTASLWGGFSTLGHHTKRILGGPVSGPGQLVLEGSNNNEFRLAKTNTFAGGLVARVSKGRDLLVSAQAPGALGMGKVEIMAGASLRLAAEGATHEDFALHLNGARSGRAASKLIIDAENTVAELHIDGEKQAAGTWGAPDSSAEHQDARLTGKGVLVVKE